MDALLSVVVFMSVAVMAWAAIPDPSRQFVRQRLHSAMAGEELSFIEQLSRWLGPLHRFLPLTWYRQYVTRKMEAAGQRMPPMHFLVLQELGALTGVFLYAVAYGFERINPLWLGVFVGCGTVLPVMWLNDRVKARRLSIGRDLPEVSDLLMLCVGAGNDFMSALSRVVREFRPCPVRDELAFVLQEIRLGKRRRDALRGFADRIKMPETSTFARTLIQADRMGTGFGEALTVLAEDMRMQRYHWAERFAQQAPLKMLFPLVLSLGSAMVIVAGPILIQFFRGGWAAGLQQHPH